MTYRRNYPDTVKEVLSSRATFRPDALRALKQFRHAKAWQGTVEERLAKFRTLNEKLSIIYGIPVPRLTFLPGGGEGNGCYQAALHHITLVGRLSVVTFLHEFGHARGMDERQTCRWSLNLFRRIFPNSFARCIQVRHMLISRNPRSSKAEAGPRLARRGRKPRRRGHKR